MNSIDGETKITGLIGSNIYLSKSFAMHNAAFKTLNINAKYIPMPVSKDNISLAISGFRALQFLGANITMPFKNKVISFLDNVTPTARDIGAVNTIFCEKGSLIGDNTDANGFLKSLQENNVQLKNRSVYIYGAGGAARAISYALATKGVLSFYFSNRNRHSVISIATMLKQSFPSVTVQEFTIVQDDNALIINCTPVGMTSKTGVQQKMLWPERQSFVETQTVVDIVYEPTTTPLLKKAKEDGAQTINGLGMLLYQAAESFVLWTKKEAPVEVMKNALLMENS